MRNQQIEQGSFDACSPRDRRESRGRPDARAIRNWKSIWARVWCDISRATRIASNGPAAAYRRSYSIQTAGIASTTANPPTGTKNQREPIADPTMPGKLAALVAAARRASKSTHHKHATPIPATRVRLNATAYSPICFNGI